MLFGMDLDVDTFSSSSSRKTSPPCKGEIDISLPIKYTNNKSLTL